MLTSMGEIDPRVELPLVDWSEVGVSGLLPTGTVTLLLADVEGSSRLWETQPEEMTAAIARFNQVVCDVITAHDGVRPVEQGEGDSFVSAFARASDAVAAALDLQRAPPALSGCVSVCTPGTPNEKRLNDQDLSARERLLAIFEPPRSEVVRGCPFHNAVVESAGALSGADEIVRDHKQEFTRRLVAVAREAGVADPYLLGRTPVLPRAP